MSHKVHLGLMRPTEIKMHVLFLFFLAFFFFFFFNAAASALQMNRHVFSFEKTSETQRDDGAFLSQLLISYSRF